MAKKADVAIWGEFEHEILGIAATFAELRKDSRDYTPPKHLTHDLKKIDKALTQALGAVSPLQLEHQEGQDIITKPFNWPVVNALSTARTIMEIRRGKNIPTEVPTYPTELIQAMLELRDAARLAIKMDNPKRGNSSRRNPSSARMADLAKNFVFRFRCRFGYMPPISPTGREVQLLERMIEAAGERSIIENSNAIQLLRTAVERDEAGRQLPPRVRAMKSPERVK